MSDCRPATPSRRVRYHPTETDFESQAGGRFALAAAVIALSLNVSSYAAAASPPGDAPIPGNIQSLVPRGWDATSYADGDFNKDGVADRAFLLEPADAEGAAQDPTRGTPLRDKCHNLVLQMGRGDGSYAAPNYLPWSFNQSRFMRHVVPADFWDSCVTSGKVFAVRDTLRFSWDYGEGEWGDGTETQVFRVEGQCLRLIGADYKGSDSFQGEEEHDMSVNFLTNTRIETHVFIEEDRAGKLRRRKEGPKTSTIEDAGPICANPTPLVAAVVAPQVQPPQASPPAPAPPKPAATPPPRYSYSPSAVSSPPPPLDCSKPPLRQKRIDNSQVGSGFDPNTPFCGLDTETSDPFESSDCQLPIIVVPLGLPFIATRDDDSVTDSIVAVNGCGLWIQTRTDGACFFESDPGCTEPPSVGEPELLRAQPDGSFLYQEDWRVGERYSLKIEPLSDERFRVTAVP